MPTRYEQLRQAIANLAAPAEAQAAHLDRLHGAHTTGSAADYGNDELALEFDDVFQAGNDMVRHGELTDAERAMVRPLNDLLLRLSGERSPAFWLREALIQDERWGKVRALAADILSRLPDERRAVGRSAWW